MDTKELLNKLVKFSVVSNSSTFYNLFGPVGVHLWDKFRLFDFDVVRFYSTLSTNNRDKLMFYLDNEL